MGNTHDELVQRLRALQVSSLCDADKTLPVLDPQIRPVVRAARFVGAAFTVIAEDDHLAVLAAVGQAEPGSVLVIATRGGTRAVAGELFTSEASRRGLAGIVIDGFCRDLTGLRAIGLPVFARGVTPMSGTMRVPPQVGIPITCGGVRVQPGDLVVADDDGVVIASADRLRDAVADAERIELGERGLVAGMARGQSLASLTNAEEHLQRVAAGQQSSFSFRDEGGAGR